MDAYEKMSSTKDELQRTFRAMWNKMGRVGAAGAATGMGKTKPAIDEMMSLYRTTAEWDGGPPKIFVAVPNEQMRDVDWPAEAERWYGQEGLLMWRDAVTCVCYISMHKYRSTGYRMVILDECHHLTQLSATFFTTPPVARVPDIMALSATYPSKDRDPDKFFLLHRIAPLIFTYPLDQGVDDGVIAPFEFRVVKVPLDSIHKTIEAGPKAKRYMTTEAARYNVLSNTIKKMHAERKTQAAEMMTIRRYQFVCNLPSKQKAAEILIAGVCTPGVRTLVFCGSIKQVDALLGDNVYHSKKKVRKGQKNALDRFREGELNTLGVVQTVNEGVNIPNVDQEIIVQMNSDPRVLVQRVGRAVRWREGHMAIIWILVTPGTQDMAWFSEAIRSFDMSRTTWYEAREGGIHPLLNQST